MEARDEGALRLQGTDIPFSFFLPKKEPDGTYSLYNGLTGKNYELNPAAALMTLLCDGTRNLDEILKTFSGQYEVDPIEARGTVYDFISSLQEKRQLVFRTSKIRKVKVPPPKYLVLEITNRCNLNCIHCSVRANERLENELTTTEWKNLLTTLAEMSVEAVGLSGGEPLLREDVFDLANHALNHGLLVGLVTNGLLLNRGIIEKIKKMNLDVQISLDGSRPQYHDKIRNQEGSFEKLLEKVRLLREEEIKFTVAAVATAHNYKDLPDLLRLSEKIGANSFRVQPFFPVGRGSLHREELDLDQSMTKFISSYLLEAKEASEIEVGGFYFQFALNSEPPAITQPCEDGACSAGYNFAGITHDGYAYPCSHIWQLAEDNIRDKPFPWIWENSRIFNFFRSLQRADTSTICQNCIYFSKCKGGCKAMNILDGHFREPDRHCWLAACTDGGS
jgi:radical SAM protein with 4Fe4S-binding SPASM domain